MTSVTRDEFETVKELLSSAARYAESANRGLDRLELAQQRTQLQLDQLAMKLDQLVEAQKKTEQRLESFIFEAQRLMIKHSESIEQLKGMTERLDGVLAYLVRKESAGEEN
ncbi:hypothetical protein HC928_11015 [bacterium]|nr:hypothetical protein [bacterium]